MSSRACPGVSAIACEVTTLTLSGTSSMDRSDRVAVTTTDARESDSISSASAPRIKQHEISNAHDPTVARLRVEMNIRASSKQIFAMTQDLHRASDVRLRWLNEDCGRGTGLRDQEANIQFSRYNRRIRHDGGGGRNNTNKQQMTGCR